MAKQIVTDSRYDFRGGRNTAISPDLLNLNELVDATNVRLSASYGGFTKRTGSQRIHRGAFPGPIQGVTQWDTPSGKQVVVISGGMLWFRTGFTFMTDFSPGPSLSIGRSTGNQGVNAGWTAGSNSLPGVAQNTTSTVAAGSRIINKVGDPAVDSNIPAVDNNYQVTFIVFADPTGLVNIPFGPPFEATVVSTVTFEYSTDNGASYNPIAGADFSVNASIGQGAMSQQYTVSLNIPVALTHLWIRPILSTTVNASGNVSGTGAGSMQVFKTAFGTDTFPVLWQTGAAAFSSQPAFFVPFRANSAGAPLVLYIASGGHYYSWDGVSVLTQLDTPPNTNAVPLTSAIISYHTRVFAMTAALSVPGAFPKTIFWSKIGDATNFTTGDKTFGGSDVTDFLTGQQLTALEVIGSSLLMATRDCVMRFTGHASDDIVISQDTEGISAEVGAIGPQALKRYENVAALMTDRGPYAVTETYVQPIGEQLNPDWFALDQVNLPSMCIEYHRARKELYFAVPRSGDGGLNKTIFSQAVRLQAWQGPWTYPFDIFCMTKYYDANGVPNVLAGGSDGFVRLLDIGNLDDVLYNGTGGSNIAIRVEIPVMHFGIPGLKKALKWLVMQAQLPIGSNLTVNVTFDGGTTVSFPVTPSDTGEEDYRVDNAGDGSSGFRCSLVFTENSSQQVTVNGFTQVAWNMQRTT